MNLDGSQQWALDQELLVAMGDLLLSRQDLNGSQIIGNLAMLLAEFVMTAPPDMRERYKRFALECVTGSFETLETGKLVSVSSSPNATTKQ